MNNRIVTEDNYKVGDKVVRGRDWIWRDQDKGSVYGIIREHEYQSENWVTVDWVNYKGIIINSKGYRVGEVWQHGELLEKFDLYFYEQ